MRRSGRRQSFGARSGRSRWGSRQVSQPAGTGWRCGTPGGCVARAAPVQRANGRPLLDKEEPSPQQEKRLGVRSGTVRELFRLILRNGPYRYKQRIHKLRGGHWDPERPCPGRGNSGARRSARPREVGHREPAPRWIKGRTSGEWALPRLLGTRASRRSRCTAPLEAGPGSIGAAGGGPEGCTASAVGDETATAPLGSGACGRLFGYSTEATDLRLLPAGLYLRYGQDIGRGENHGRARCPSTAQSTHSAELQPETEPV